MIWLHIFIDISYDISSPWLQITHLIRLIQFNRTPFCLHWIIRFARAYNINDILISGFRLRFDDGTSAVWGENYTCLPCVFSLTISTSIYPILSFLFSLSPILSLFSLFQQVRTLFALPVLFRVQVLRWVIDACWNLFSPHPFHCLIDESDRVQVQPRRVWEPAVDGVWCTRTGERSFSTCALQSELWWKPPIGFGHYIHTFLFPITVALLSGDRTKPVRLGWWSTQEESVTEDDCVKVNWQVLEEGDHFEAFPPLVLMHIFYWLK